MAPQKICTDKKYKLIESLDGKKMGNSGRASVNLITSFMTQASRITKRSIST